MCQLTQQFNNCGFEVASVSLQHKKPLVFVNQIPKRWVLNKNLPRITERFAGKTRTLRIGEHLGCRVALIESER